MSLDDALDARRRALALFRAAVLAELDAERLPRGELSLRIAALATRPFTRPDGRARRFSVRTLWAWWSAAKRAGLLGLVPCARSDKGVPRTLTPELLAAAIEARKEVPSRSTPTLIDVLVRQRLVAKGTLARATLDRHLAHVSGHSIIPTCGH